MVSKNFLRWHTVLCFTVLALIALGGAVRAMNAGLACPDWPLCFGEYVPDYHPQVYFEFIHRVLAGTVGIVTLILNGTILLNKKLSRNVRILAGVSFLLLGSQVILGGLTVLKLLQSMIVTLHLIFGLGFLTCLMWINLSLRPHSVSIKIPSGLRLLSVVVLGTIVGQIILGGSVASNYAGLACPDFPLCNGSFIPTLSGGVGLHVLHRLGAYLTFVVVVGFYILLRGWDMDPKNQLLKVARALISLVLLQAALGIANIKFYLPALITVLHTLVAATIVAAAVYIVFLVWTNAARNRLA